MQISLDIFSDPICPWCMIGKARLDRAEAERGAPIFQRRWRVFQLNPHMPPEGVDRRAYLETKFGGKEGADRVYGGIAATAERDGLDVDLDRIRRTPSTVNAHRLLKWVEPLGGQDAVMDALFDAYFRKGEDISAPSVLIRAGEAGGLDAATTETLLAGDAEREVVSAEDEMAREIGVSGAPTFIIAGQHVAPGALETSMWLQVIEELLQSVNVEAVAPRA